MLFCEIRVLGYTGTPLQSTSQRCQKCNQGEFDDIFTTISSPFNLNFDNPILDLKGVYKMTINKVDFNGLTAKLNTQITHDFQVISRKRLNDNLSSTQTQTTTVNYDNLIHNLKIVNA